MPTKKEFLNLHQEAVDLIKAFKSENDYLNKNIGVTSSKNLLNELNSRKSSCSKNIERINGQIAQL